MIPAKAQDREFRQMVQVSWREEARRRGKPVCETCAREDYKKGKQDWKNFDEIEKYIIKNDVKPEKIAAITDRKDSTKQLGEFQEYHCPRGHGLAFEVTYPRKTVEIATVQISEQPVKK